MITIIKLLGMTCPRKSLASIHAYKYHGFPHIIERQRGGRMSGLGTENLEHLKGTHLDSGDQRELLSTQSECSFVYLTEGGWPAGVVMSFIHSGGKFWLTAVEGRAHVRAAERDKRVSVIVSSAGSG